MFPLPPSEAAVIGELQRLLGAREIDMQPTPVLALPGDDGVVPVVEGARLMLWDAA